jgi:hypothetical protein
MDIRETCRDYQTQVESLDVSSLAVLWPAAACLIAGAALYVTRGVLDQVVTPTGALRIALLPPWTALVGFICVAIVGLVVVDHMNAPRGSTAVRRPRLRELVLPLFGLAVLLIPFAPVIPDRWPVLQILAGPLRAVVWLVVIAQTVWVLWQSRILTASWIQRWSLNRVTVAIWLVTVLTSAAAAARLTETTLFPGGDEPHYLVIAQSLWRDHDLKIENNHTRGDYYEYFKQEIAPHYLTHGSDGEIYSVHPIGLPILIAPVLGLGGYRAVVWLLILMSATAATIAWRWAVAMLNAPGAATFAWAAIVGSTPFLFNTFTVYPEIAAALAVMIVLALARKADLASAPLFRLVCIGLTCGALPWLSTKYAPMSAVLMAVALARVLPKVSALSRPTAAIALPYLASLVAWIAFFYIYWGSPWPSAPYGQVVQTSPRNLILGAPGLLFDQEYGLLAYAPIYVLGFTGLWAMWRSGGELRRQAVEIKLIFLSLLASVGAFGIWWGGSAAPARPLASGLLLFSLPIAAAFRAAPAGSAERAGQHVLLWIGVGIALTLALAQQGLLINNWRDGSSSLLEWWSPRWDLWRLAPSFVLRNAPLAYLHTAWWLLIAMVTAVVLSRWRRLQPGGAALAAVSALAAALVVVALTFPWLPANDWPLHADLQARSRLTAIDEFDVRARPAALVYDPLRKVAAVDVLPMLALVIAPETRPDPQPLRVIHNGRLSLPAGVYNVDVTWADRTPAAPTPISWQIGRLGPPLSTWTLEMRANQRWQTSVDLPVDANFVGFRGSNEVERAVKSIVVTPARLIDEGARPHLPAVLAAARYEDVNVFFHDEQLYAEVAGFWTMGKRKMAVTMTTSADRPKPIALRIHCGLQANRVTLTTRGWTRTFDLVPMEPQIVELPASATGVIPLSLATENGFSPSQNDPSSKDRRFLGIWVEVVKE